MAENNWIFNVRSDTLQTKLFGDLTQGCFTDITTFRVGPDGNQGTFNAHRLVLASENSEFEKMLHEFDDSGIIKMPDVNPKAFENLLRYCYGESFLFKDLTSIRETYLAAKKFKAPNLQRTAENNLIELLKSEPAVQILKICIELNMPRAKERCLEKISSQFEKVLMTEELMMAPFEVLKSILSLCSDQGLEFNLHALFTILEWAKLHQCPNATTRRLLSMVQHGTPYDRASFLRRKSGQLTESQIRAINKYLLSEAYSRKNGINGVGNTDVSLEDTSITKEEPSEKMEIPLEENEVITDMSELNCVGNTDVSGRHFYH